MELNFSHKQIQSSGIEGYGDYYLKLKWNKKLAENEAKKDTYGALIKIDSDMGAEMSKQVINCCHWSLRTDLLDVSS